MSARSKNQNALKTSTRAIPVSPFLPETIAVKLPVGPFEVDVAARQVKKVEWKCYTGMQ
jgi:hypothetical protein